MELEQGEESLGDDILNLSTADIQARTRLLDNEVVCAFLFIFLFFYFFIFLAWNNLYRLLFPSAHSVRYYS